MNAEFVVADSFHGFCFSLIFNKPFFAVINRARGSSRFDTLSKLMGVEDRLIENFTDLNSITKEKALNIDYEKINARMSQEITRSKEWLHNALFSDREIKQLSSEILNGKDLYLQKKAIKSLHDKITELEKELEAISKSINSNTK